MNPEAFAIAGWSLVLLAPPAAFLAYRATSSRIHTVFPYSTILAMIYLAGICLWLPCQGMQPDYGPVLLMESARKSFRMFTMTESVEAFLQCARAMSFSSAGAMKAFEVLGILLFALCPCLTVGFLLSCFRRVSARFRIYSHRNRDKYVFSQLNDASLALAGSIKSRFPKAILIFTAVAESEQNTAHALSQKACAMDAILLKEGITQIHWDRYAGKGITGLFTVADQNTNLYQASDLVKQYAKRKDFRLYVFAEGVESEALFNTALADGMRIRRIDPMHTVINHALYENGYEIFQEAAATGGREKLISIAVVGMGRCGTELVRTLTWFCQMNGYRLRIHAFDRDSAAESRFRMLCPELMSPEHNGIFRAGDAQYEIEIHGGVDVRTAEFYEQLQKIGRITRIYVTLGDDTLNIHTAIAIRTELSRFAAMEAGDRTPAPTILAQVESTQKKESLQNMRDYQNNRYNIRLVGDIKTVYTCELILDSRLEQEALQRHLRWTGTAGDEQSFWASEMNYQSSVAAAIHAKMRILCQIPGADRQSQDLTPEERTGIEELEHRRWTAYMRGCGYCYSGSPAKSSRNDLAKLHNNLVPYWDLPKNIRCKDSRVGLL